LFPAAASALPAFYSFDGEKGAAGLLMPDSPVFSSPSEAKPSKEITFMVYKNAKNDLEEFGFKDMNEMEAAGSDENVNIVAEFGKLRSSGAGGWSGARRYYIEKDADPVKITSPVIWEQSAVDMGDWGHLADFITWAKANYPAKRYVLVIWNHGNGWKKSAGRAISFDDETDNHISTPQLSKVFERSGPVALLAFDACLMQTAEVAYEVRKYAEVIAASEDTEPGEGYPYDRILNRIKSSPTVKTEEIGKILVEEFQKSNEELNMNTTHSAIRTAALEKLLQSLGVWSRLALAEPDQVPLKYAANKAQAFYEYDQKDLYDFMSIVSGLGVSQALKLRSAGIAELLAKEVVIANGISGYQHLKARGLALYLPMGYSYNDDYNVLAWAKDGFWDEFIGREAGPAGKKQAFTEAK